MTIQAQILDLLVELKEKINSSIMLITHDLGVVAGMADYVVVMYAGRVVEKGTADDIFHHPAHPYTIGLMRSKPVVGKKVDELYNITGAVPNPVDMPTTATSATAATCAATSARASIPGDSHQRHPRGVLLPVLRHRRSAGLSQICECGGIVIC